ncbi:LpxD N-terminal domain-containing protein, partial [Solemya elarraichensis gill symbiont]
MSNPVSPISLEKLVTIAGGVLTGDGSHLVDGVAPLHDAQSHQVAALTNSRYRNELENSGAGCIIVAEKDAKGLNRNRVIHPDPSLGFARVSRYFNPPKPVLPGVAGSAVIHATATVAASAEIGANTVIGANVVIGDGVLIGPGCVILENTVVGESSHLLANVTLCEGVEIGAHC